MISYREAIANALVPALLVGPMLGAVAAFLSVSTGLLLQGGNGDLAIAIFATVVGLVLGLITAGPICLVLGALMLWLVVRRPEWGGWIRIGVVGAIAGSATGALFALISAQGVEQVLGATALTALLGAIGGLTFRYLARRPIAEMLGAQADIFD